MKKFFLGFIDKIKKNWSKTLLTFLLVSFGLIVIDFATKWIVELNVALDSPVTVIPNFFYINKSYNTAIAFSLGSTWGVGGRILNISISVILSIAILLYWLTHDKKFGRFERVLALLLFSGAFGNLIDRAFYWEGTSGFNGVIDFLQFYLGGGPSAGSNFFNPFATFNIADAYLTIGIFLLLIYLIVDIIKGDSSPKEKKPAAIKKEEPSSDLPSQEEVELEKPTEETK